MPYLYPKDYKGEPVKTVVVDRTPTQRQRDDCKTFVDTKLGGVPKDYNEIMPQVLKQFPCVFTTSELVVLFDEMNADRDPEKLTASAVVAEELGVK